MPRAVVTSLALLLLASPATAQPKADPPKLFPPDAETLLQIEAKTAELRKAVAVLPKGTPDDVISDVAVYAKAAEWIVRHGEWYTKDSGRQTLAVLDAGLERAKAAAQGKTPWRDVRGRPIIRGYRSTVDSSVQPYSVTLPHGFSQKGTRWRMDTVLHGRDQTLTEVKFIHARQTAKAAASGLDYVILEPYGRGNNAYRWAGETDVQQAEDLFQAVMNREGDPFGFIDDGRRVLRGFSMGGAGTWHIGLRNPFRYAVLGPGAGFTTTRGYIRNLPAQLPDYQEKCLRIYDAVEYSENVFNVPVVAYSGEKDPQKAAADNVAARLKGFELPVRLTHLVAPGLEHRMPPDWQAKAEAEYRKHLAGRDWPPGHVRFVTYTTRDPNACYAFIRALDRHYERAALEGRMRGERVELSTINIRAMEVTPFETARSLVIDGQEVAKGEDLPLMLVQNVAVKRDGKWSLVKGNEWQAGLRNHPEKTHPVQGPIDDAFRWSFFVVPAVGKSWHEEVERYAMASKTRFAAEWDKYFRGVVRELPPDQAAKRDGHLILFGDPGSNPLIARVIDKLPITWTRDKLVVNGMEYDPATHVPVLIYPNPLNPAFYVVINSGHTFRETDLKGTNALLYPRLGDWAVLRPTPTAKEPAAAKVIAAGLFDEFWQFPVRAAAPGGELKSFAAPGAKLEKLWGDGVFTEGPTPGPDGAIYFSDIGNRILRFDPKTSKTTTYRDPSGRSNGLKFDAKGRLVACEGANTGGNRRVSVTEKSGEVRTLADKWMGKRFNSPNDLTIDAMGRVYFTDPRYVGDEPREIDTESVYRIDPDGTVTQVITDVTKPNGIVLSPDGKTLYLAETNGDMKRRRQLLAYPLKDDGTVGAKKVLHDFGDDRGIDGMAMTADGLIVATAGRGKTAGVYFFTPEGKKVGFVPTPEDTSNCCFGGPGSKVLYITAGKCLYRIELTVAGR
jgi:sugar lactone lactonase YvrE